MGSQARFGQIHAVPNSVQFSPALDPHGRPTILRRDFPSDFTFGVATSSVQIEGASGEGGRGPGIWDTFAKIPGKIVDGSTPAVACDHFSKFQEDIPEMKKMGVSAYRFSISWPRIFPDGSGRVNHEGVDFYNSVINCVIQAGMTPFVTLYHWDLPQVLENDPEVNGWRTENIVKHFVIFADTCFKYFGDRVKYWSTFNEIRLSSVFGYGLGWMAPGRNSNRGTEPYIVAHNSLLSHAAAVKLYRAKYQKEQKGLIGPVADVSWYEPLTPKKQDVDAAQRFHEFEIGWILDPLFQGDYPRSMRERVGDRLPEFTQQESEDLKGSADFIGINYYTATYAADAPEEKDSSKKWWYNDSAAYCTYINHAGNLIGPVMGPPGTEWLRSCAWGLRKALAWIDQRYGKIPLYITENGTMDPHTEAPLEVALDDEHRVTYMKEHLMAVARSIREDKVNVKGYFVWTLMDNWEWANGFNWRFGLYYVDFKDNRLIRHPKASAKWYSSFLTGLH